MAIDARHKSSAGLPPEFGPPPFPGGTRTIPAYPRISFGG
jgi:hypothetical protein